MTADIQIAAILIATMVGLAMDKVHEQRRRRRDGSDSTMESDSERIRDTEIWNFVNFICSNGPENVKRYGARILHYRRG